MQTTLQALLESDDPIVADGGMGTLLLSKGLTRGEAPESWNVNRPDDIRQIHRDYIEAGAQIILTNSFGGTRYRLGMYDLGDRVTALDLTERNRRLRLDRTRVQSRRGKLV